MDCEFAMRDELYNTDFCFSRQDLYDKEKQYDYSQKFYGFDCNIGSFCCYVDDKNIIKIIDIAKKYNLEDIFLEKTFNMLSFLNFKNKSNEELRKENKIPDDFPVIFWFHRGYNSFIKDPLYLKDYINDLV